MEFKDEVIKKIETISKDENDNLNKASLIMYQAMRKELLVHAFATGHSHMFLEELFYRAGGLVQINPILIPSLMQHEGAISSTKREREEGLAAIIYQGLDLKDGEPFIIVSNSGINNVPVEMAKIVKEHNHPLIVITSMEMTTKATPRNKDNKRLYEYADVVIDNHSPYGDGIINKPYGNIGAISSIMGSYIAQELVIRIVNLYEQDNLIPPIYLSANTKDGDNHNLELIKKYQKRIKCLY